MGNVDTKRLHGVCEGQLFVRAGVRNSVKFRVLETFFTATGIEHVRLQKGDYYKDAVTVAKSVLLDTSYYILDKLDA